jgi:uncharacterized protein YajQ (UPF0234 family)
MTAKEEDILTNQSYIKQGTVLDKLIQSLIVTKVDYNDLIIGDKNALMVASRILGYGKDYDFVYRGEKVTVDLTKIENKVLDESLFTKGKNEFEFKVPSTSDILTFKLLTHGDELKVDQEIESLKKIGQNTEKSTRLKYMITSINDNREAKSIRDYVDNYLLAKDALALRTYINKIQPDVDLTVTVNTSNGPVEGVSMPIGLDFFWPDLGI